MTSIVAGSAMPILGINASKAYPIIIATDGQPQSDGALALGRLLAGESNAVRLVTVLRPLPMVPDAGEWLTPDMVVKRRNDIEQQVEAQTIRDFGRAHPVEILDGDPATLIARVAHEACAAMIVCGIGRHNVVDRILGDETALRIVRLADVPVLAVAEKHLRQKSIVVACDFSETSLRAARAAIALAAQHAVIYLVHVAPRDHTRYEWDGWTKAYKQDSLDALRATKGMLRPAEGTVVQTVILQGDTATELLRFADNVNADLIATGSHGHGFVARMLIGSVATRILRAATRSVLTVPHAAAMTTARATTLPPVGRMIPRDDWASALDQFSRANIGRRALLEVDDAELGAQAQEFDYPFRGASFDHHDGRVTLMFGANALEGNHFSRGIAAPTSVDVLSEPNDRDVALRISHGKGQTLLTFAA